MLKRQEEEKDDDRQLINTMEFIEFEYKFILLKKGIRQCIKQCELFWTELLRPRLAFKQLCLLGRQIQKEHQECRILYQRLKRLMPLNVRLHTLYSEYIEEVYNEESTWQQTPKRMEVQQLLKSHQENHLGDKSVIEINGQQADLGKVEFANEEVSEGYGFSHSQIQGLHMSVIVPTIWRTQHDTFIKMNMKSRPSRNVLNSIRDSYAQSRLGFIVPSQILVKLLPKFS